MTSSRSDQLHQSARNTANAEAREFLETRQSEPMLSGPAPSQELLGGMLDAVARSPDHGNLKPYRFMVLSGAALEQFGSLLLKAELAAADTETPAAQQDKIRSMPLRAPMIIVGIVQLSEHPKVPAIEQWLAAGCAVQTLSLLLETEGYGVMWRSGKYAYDRFVASSLGLTEQEAICAFLYCGTISQTKRNRPDTPVQDSLMSFHTSL